NLSEAELAQKIAELEEMRGLIENARSRAMAEHWQRHPPRWLNDTEDPPYHATFFVVSPELYVLARLYSGGQPLSLDLSIIDGPVSEFRPFFRLEKERPGVCDDTMQGLENDAPTISKDRA